MLYEHMMYMACQMVDSHVETTRIYWRTKYFNCTHEEARDPRPFEQVLEEREAREDNHNIYV